MTKINDYLWHLPHTPLDDDPLDVIELQQRFNQPIVSMLEPALNDLGYELRSSDIAVQLDDQLDNTKNSYYANVRFIRYLSSDIFARVHFEHVSWATFMAESEVHHFYINLDRFKVSDPATQIAIPAWEGRLHSRMSHIPGGDLHHNGEDQIWSYASAEELEQNMQTFLDKFHPAGKLWLEDSASMS